MAGLEQVAAIGLQGREIEGAHALAQPALDHGALGRRELDADVLLQWSEREAIALPAHARGSRVCCAGCGEEVASSFTHETARGVMCLDCAEDASAVEAVREALRSGR